MKRNLLILLAFTISFSLYSQDNVKKNRLGVFFNSDKNLSSKNIAFDEYSGNSIEYNHPNYKIGLSAEHKLSNSFTINSGVNYSNKYFSQTYYCTICNFIIAPMPQKVKLQFIEIPISFRYYFLPNRLKIYADIGLINQFSMRNENIDNRYILSGKLVGGLEYNISKEFAVQFITEYNKGFISLYKEHNFKINYISFGFGIMKKI